MRLLDTRPAGTLAQPFGRRVLPAVGPSRRRPAFRRLKTAGRVLMAVLPLVAGSSGATAQLMALPGKVDVNNTGAATYSIPIAVPPGTAGIAPSLSLDYNSQGGNGVLGMGWSLSGLTAITRCPQTQAQDGVHGTIRYDANDRFCLRGQRLVAINGGAYGADGTEYRTEIESFSRIISHGMAAGPAPKTGPAWFEVHTKAGQVLEFGHTPDSQILVQGTTTVRVWAEDKVSDSKGNYFTITYAANPTGASAAGTVPVSQAYPLRIDYTGNAGTGLQPYNSVQFTYSTRPDIVPIYQGGSPIISTVLLTDVKTFAGSTLVSDYQLAYQQSQSNPASGRSRLTTLTRCFGDGFCQPATSFAWSDVPLSFSAPAVWISDKYVTASGFTNQDAFPRFLVDVNGDGLADVVGFGGATFVSPNQGTTLPAPQVWNSNFGSNLGWTSADTSPRFLVDVNGDGLPDVVGFSGGGVNVALNNNGTGFNPETAWLVGVFGSAADGGGWTSNNIFPRFVVDVDGDGLPDIVGFSGSGVMVARNTGTNFAAPTMWLPGFFGAATAGGGWTNSNIYPRFLVDVNGDGLPDIVAFGPNGVQVALNTGTSFAAPTTWLANAFGTATTAGGWSTNDEFPRFLVDVNGDGLPDIVGFSGSGVLVALNTGTSFAAPKAWLPGFFGAVAGGWTSSNINPRFLADVNGDGLPDIVGFSGSGVLVALNTGTSFAPPMSWLPGAFGVAAGGWSSESAFPRFMVDANGDGRADIVGFGGSNVFVATAMGSGIPDRLVTITGGLGATTTITYQPLSGSGIYGKDIGTQLPLVDFVGPLYAVAEIDANDGAGGVHSTTYSYVGAKVDISGRGFVGFRQVMARDGQTGLEQFTVYRQDYPFTGFIDSQFTFAQQASTLVQLGQIHNTYSATALGGTGGVHNFVALTQSVVARNDLNGAALPTVTTTYQYDNATSDPTQIFGNVTQLVTSTSDGFGKVTTNTYSNDTTHWFLGRLTGTSVTSTTP